MRHRIHSSRWSLGAAAIGAVVLAGVSAAAPSAVGRQALFLDGSAGRALERAPVIPNRQAGEPQAGRGATTVIVEARSGRASAATAAVSAVGGRVERTWRNLVQARLSAQQVAALSTRSSIDRVRQPMRMVTDAISGEEVAASVAPAWHAKGFTGKGVKVAIIDGGFQGLAERQAAGDLPSNVVTMDFCGGRFGTDEDHGTAVAEIVHEMAPDAQLFLLCINTEVDFAAAIAFAKAQGVNVVNHSASWFGPDRGDGTGPIGAMVTDARAAGILWVNSAGNYARTHWSGTFVSADGDRVHDWAPGDEGNTFVWPNDSEICGILKWDEWPAGVSDFDLYLVNSATGVVLARSDDEQTGSQPPVEGLCVGQRTGSNLTVYWAIVGYDVRSTPRFDLFSLSPSLQYQTAAGSLGEPATSRAALAVGALCWQTRQLEYYSSQGPTIDGRQKPEIAGHDSVSGSTYGGFSSCPSAFAGTSASSPEVAGAAALVKQAFPAYGPDQLQQYLVKAARDMGAPGADNETGAGELQLPTPPDVVKPSAKAMASAGKPGKIVKLAFAAGDDSGSLEVVDRVKHNGRVVATIRKSVNAVSPKSLWVPWQAPAKPKGAYQHCVVGTDGSGNASPESCAQVKVR